MNKENTAFFFHPYFILSCICFVFYGVTLNSYFVADDFGFIHLFSKTNFSDWLSHFLSDYNQELWGKSLPELRPIEALTYMIDWKLWGVNPMGYHLSNLFLHILNTLLVWKIAEKLTKKAQVSLLAGILFAIHPTHIETVSWISGRNDLVVTLFCLISFYSFILFRAIQKTRYFIFSLFSLLLALFSKEMAICFPLLLLGYDYFVHSKGNHKVGLKHYRVHLVSFGILFAYLLIRLWVFGSFFGSWQNPEGLLSLSLLKTFLFNQIHFINLLVFPLNVFKTQVSDLVLILLLFVPSILGFIFYKDHFMKSFKDLGFYLIFYLDTFWYIVAVLPLLLAPPDVRYLYLVSVGFCILLPLILNQLLSKRLFIIVMSAYLIFMGSILTRENLRWNRAAKISKTMTEEITHPLVVDPKELKIILDPAYKLEGVHVWPWSLPYALMPPFTVINYYKFYTILENPRSYCCPSWNEDKVDVILEMKKNPQRVFHLIVDEDGKVHFSDRPLASKSVFPMIERFEGIAKRWWSR